MFAFMPILIGGFAVNYQIGLSVYWIVSTVAYIGEYLWVVGRPPTSSQASTHEGVSRPPGQTGS